MLLPVTDIHVVKYYDFFNFSIGSLYFYDLRSKLTRSYLYI